MIQPQGGVRGRSRLRGDGGQEEMELIMRTNRRPVFKPQEQEEPMGEHDVQGVKRRHKTRPGEDLQPVNPW